MTNYASISKTILKLSFPLIMGRLGNVLLGLTDTIMVGNFGKNELAAVGLSNQIFFLITVIGMGVMAALTPIVASSKGAENQRECGEFLRSGIELSIVISIIIFLILVAISLDFKIFEQSLIINNLSSKYLRILSVSVFPMLLFMAMKHFNDGLAFSKPAMYITFLGVGLNVALNWVFIYGNLSFPRMGADGAAIATLITRIIMAIIMVFVVFRNSRTRLYLPPLISTYNTLPVIRKLLKIGFPTGLQMFFEVGAYAVATIGAGWISLSALAAHQISMGIVALCYMVATGIGFAGSIEVAHAFGKGDVEDIKKKGMISITISMFIMCITSLILICFETPIIYLFTKDAEVIDLTRHLFVVLIWFQLVNGLKVAGLGILRAVEDVTFPAAFTLLAYWLIGLPCFYFFGVHLHQKLSGVWDGLLVSLLFSFVVLMIRFFHIIYRGKSKNYTAAPLDLELKSADDKKNPGDFIKKSI